MPKISVIMSVFNGEKYLHEAVSSVLQQTFDDFEFIIIDDCSTDTTPQILNEYATKDSRIKIYRKEKNIGFKGFVENLNLGLKEAKGEYIARMDADDVCHADRFQKQHDFLEKNKNIFLIGSSARHINENNETIGGFFAETNYKKLEAMMLKKNFVYHPTIMFRNSKNLFYRDKFVGCEDYDFYLRLQSEGKTISNLSDRLLSYRILQDSISRRDKRFVRWLFIEKAKEFYTERVKTGKDSYDTLLEEDFINISDKNYTNSEEDLVFACKTATKFSDRNSLLEILEKLKVQYPKSKFAKKYSLFAQFPESHFHWAKRLNLIFS